MRETRITKISFISNVVASCVENEKDRPSVARLGDARSGVFRMPAESLVIVFAGFFELR